MHAITSTGAEALMSITPRPEPVMLRGEGSRLWDDRGTCYLDLIQGWAVNALGHCPPEIQAALTAQAGTLITPSPALHNAPQLTLARRLAQASGLARVHFANSGAEANEAAVKLARRWGRRERDGAFEILTTHGGFHGRTLAMMAASGKAGWDAMFPPILPGFRKVEFGDAQAMDAAVGPDTVAIMVEPVQGEAGVVMPPPGYLQALREVADRHDILLILDEVQTGMARTGRLFAAQHEAVQPDIMTLGKGLGGGVPISAMLAGERAGSFRHGEQGGTYNGNPLMTAVGLAVLEAVSPAAFLARVEEAGRRLMQGLEDLGAARGVVEVRGRGLLIAARLAQPVAEAVRDRALAAGLLVNAPRPDLLRFMPSLRISDAEIDEALSLLAASLD